MKSSSLIFGTVLMMALGSVASGDPVLTVVASPAPNFVNFPSFVDYNTNALNSLENGLGEIGDRNLDPTAYEIFDEGEQISIFEVIVSSFESWRGVANPSVPFDQEHGNRLHFGLHVLGDGVTQFRLEDLLFDISSTDGSLNFSGDFIGLDYNNFRVGVNWGADRMKGGGDDIYINSGAATQVIDELIYVGVGNAFNATGQPGGTDQEKIDSVPQSLLLPIDVTGTYTLNDASGNLLGQGSTYVTVVPEPTGLTFLALSGLTVALRRRR